MAAKKIKASEEIKASAPHVIDEDPGLKDLLEKTRQVGRVLQSRREGTKPDYNKLAKLLCEFSTANVYLINREVKILGYSWISEYHSEEVSNFIDKGYMPEIFVEKMNQHRETILSETDASWPEGIPGQAQEEEPAAEMMTMVAGGFYEQALAGDFSGTVVTVDGPFADADTVKFEQSVASFEEATGIDIQYIGGKEFEGSIGVRVEADDAPDIADFPQPGLLATFVRQGYVVDVSTFLDAVSYTHLTLPTIYSV